jgi:dihydroxy-acid dehydratase
MLMAAARLDIPAILVAGGPMEGGCEFDERAADMTSLTEGLPEFDSHRHILALEIG